MANMAAFIETHGTPKTSFDGYKPPKFMSDFVFPKDEPINPENTKGIFSVTAEFIGPLNLVADEPTVIES